MRFLSTLILLASALLISPLGMADSIKAGTTDCNTIESCIQHTIVSGEFQEITPNATFIFYAANSSYRNAFVFDPKRLKWTAHDANGRAIKSGRASGGKGYCSDVKRRCRTPIGNFSVYRKGSAGCRSSKFPLGRGGAPMPYCMFFRGGYAIHGSYDVPNHNASHGCIRVKPDAARWLHKNFIKNGTRVIVRPY